MTARNTFQKHLAAIYAGEVTKSNIIGLRKALNANARKRSGYTTSATSPKVTATELSAAIDMIYSRRPKVVGDLHDSGIRLLQDRRYAKRLAPYADIIAHPSHFELCGFESIGVRGTYHTPVYRLTGQNGKSFQFINIPWQSGGNGPEIV